VGRKDADPGITEKGLSNPKEECYAEGKGRRSIGKGGRRIPHEALGKRN